MNALQQPYFIELLVRAVVVVLFAGSLLCLAAGAALVFHTTAALRLMKVANRWVSSDEAVRTLDAPHNFDAAISKVPTRRLILGALVALGGIYAVVVLVSQVDVPKLVSLFGVRAARASVAIALIDALRIFLILGCAIAVVVGTILSFFPAAWARLEARLNLWYSTQPILTRGNVMYMALDRWVERYPRTAGALIGILSIIPAVAAGILLFGRAS